MAWTTPGTAVAGSVLTSSFWNAQVRDNLLEVAPFFAAWTTWTPTWTNFTIGTGGSATNTGKYLKIGKFVAFWGQGTLGSSGASVGTNVNVTVPVTAANKASYNITITCIDTGVQSYPLTFPHQDATTTQFRIMVPISSTTYVENRDVAANVPFTWGAGDSIFFAGTYEAA